MGTIRSEIEKLESEREMAALASAAERLEDDKRQIQRMREIVEGLLPDREYLRRLRVSLGNWETGEDLGSSTTEPRGVGVVDDLRNRFNDVTIGYDSGTGKYYAIEWRSRMIAEPGVDPFEVQRVVFDDAEECLRWLGRYLHSNLDAQFADKAI